MELLATLEIYLLSTTKHPSPPCLALQDRVTLKKNLHVLEKFTKWCNTNNLIPSNLYHHTLSARHTLSIPFPFSNSATSCFAPLLVSITGDEPCRARVARKKRQINHSSRMWDITAGQKQKDKAALLCNWGKGQGEARRRRTGERSTGTGKKQKKTRNEPRVEQETAAARSSVSCNLSWRTVALMLHE